MSIDPARISLGPVSHQLCMDVLAWRHDPATMKGLRTPFFLTEPMQETFYRDVIGNRTSPHQYVSLSSQHVDRDGAVSERLVVGMGGMTNIAWENRTAEISLILNPRLARRGLGRMCVTALVTWGFSCLNLNNIYGECYECNPALGFWKKIVAETHGYSTRLPARKFADGEYFGSYYFGWLREEWPS